MNQLPSPFPVQRPAAERPAFVSDLDRRILFGSQLSEPFESSCRLMIWGVRLGIVIGTDLQSVPAYVSEHDSLEAALHQAWSIREATFLPFSLPTPHA